MPDLRTLGDEIDVCLARSEGVMDESDWTALLGLRHRVRNRSGFVGEVVIVALAGGTGSGKSSLINAVSGKPVAEVSIERPTTSQALAVVPEKSPADLDPLLETLGITDTAPVDTLDHTVIVDLPDFDSTFADHREIVSRVLKVVDAVAWVFDPEKYADSIIHEQFLRPLVDFEHQMLFVLNQADRLGGHEDLVVESLRSHLVDDGYSEPEIVTTVAAASEKVDIDVDELRSAIARRFDAKRSVFNRLATEVGLEANRLWKRLAARSERSEADAFAMASLVSLGVTAAEVRHRYAGRA